MHGESFPSFSDITFQITRENIDQEPPEKWQNKKGGLMTILEDICEPTTENDLRKAANREIEKCLCIDSCSEQKPPCMVEELRSTVPKLD